MRRYLIVLPLTIAFLVISILFVLDPASSAAASKGPEVLGPTPTPTPIPPIVADDLFTAHGDTFLPNVFLNDTAPPGAGPFNNHTDVTQTTHGTLEGVAAGSFLYRPNFGYVGSDSFTYRGCVGLGNCSVNTATVNIDVVNQPPVANPDFYIVPPPGYVIVDDIAGNDSDADDGPTGFNVALDSTWHPPIYATLGRCGERCWSVSQSGFYYVGLEIGQYRDVDYLGAHSNITSMYFFHLPLDGLENAGWYCSIGEPVNPTNGNMWLQERDYSLSGVGENIEINRFYNSINQSSGLFGFGWSTKYDEFIEIFSDSHLLGLHLPDGRAEYYGRTGTSGPYTNVITSSGDQLVKNPDNSYTANFKDGRVHQFDSTGKLVWQKDRNGNQTTLGYDIDNHLTSVTDPFGRILILTPNANGAISQISDSMGVVADYEYYPGTALLKTIAYHDNSKYKFEYDTTSASGKTLLKTVKDALDNVLETHLYDSQGRALTSEKDGGVEKYSFNYAHIADTAPYTIVTHKKKAGDPDIATNYYFDGSRHRNVITKIEGLCGCGSSGSETTTYQYDNKLNLVKEVDALSNETNYTYNSTGDLLTKQDVLGTSSYTYNSLGEILTSTDRMGGVTTNTFSATGNLLTSKDALNNTTTLTYTTLGQLATIKDALNHTTTLTYDTQGRLTQVKDANNKSTNIAYDARVRPTSVTNALTETTSFEYDLNNRLKKVIYPDTNFIAFAYDLAGRRTSMTDARNNTTTYGYDTAYRLTSITDALTHSTNFGYDLMSNLTSQSDALGNITNYEYNDFNRLKKIVHPPFTSGATRLEESLTYDTVGNVKTRADTDGRTTSYLYDTSNRLTSITDAANQMTQFEYNARSQMTKVIDALSQQYTFTYDPLGRELSQTRAGTTMSFEYDAVGSRTKRTDYMGRVTNYEYDNLNRPKKVVYAVPVTNGGPPNPQSTYTYDDLSRLISAVNNAGTVSFTYDNRNRVKTTTDVFGHTIEYGYDANSNRNLLKLDGSNYATYAYDVVDRLTTISNIADSTNIGFGYDNANRLTSRAYPNSVNTTYEYDGMSRLTRLKDLSTTATLFDRQYSYNAANQISQVVEPTQTRVFGYDNVDRLTSVTNPTNGNESYVFDAVGNRTSSHRSSTYSYQSFNKLASTQTATYSSDADGNMTSKGEGSNFWRYGWDFENRLTQASTRKQSVRYKYDALGRRVQRIVGYGKENTKFIYDGADVLADDNAGTLTKYLNDEGIDSKLRVQTGTDIKYFLADHLGSTNGLTDATGALTSQTVYDSFGNQTGSLATRYGFTGREFDSFSGLQYNRARFYDPNIGRFISEDPIGFKGRDINLYGYVRNQPLIFRDSSGLYPGVDIIANPNILGPVAAALSAAGAAIGVAASSPAVVAGAGFAAGYAIGYYPGQWTANHPSNPYVNGPLNPFPIWDRFWEPKPTTACQPMPRAIPWTRSPSIPWPEPDPDRDGCTEEWARAYEWCAENIGRPDMRRGTGGYKDLHSCARGRVSQRCGGNPIDWGN